MRLALLFLFINLLWLQQATAQVSSLLESVQKTLSTHGTVSCEAGVQPDVDVDTICPGFTDLVAATKAKQNELDKVDPFGFTTSRESAGLTEKLYTNFDSCQKSVAEHCHRGLRPVSKSKLFEDFETWTRNPYYRMRDPGVSCLGRAKLLAQELTKKNVQASLLEINQTPMGKAVILDKSGKATKEYYDYQNHWVVVVEDETKTKYILDPQFQNTPQGYDSYFSSFAGKDCEEKVDGKSFSRWDCTYKIKPPTYVFPDHLKTIEAFLRGPQCYPNLDGVVNEIEAHEKETFSMSEKRPPNLSETEFTSFVKEKGRSRICGELDLASTQLGLTQGQKSSIEEDLKRCNNVRNEGTPSRD